MDQQNAPSTAAGKPSFLKSPTSIKDNLLKWTVIKTRGYKVC